MLGLAVLTVAGCHRSAHHTAPRVLPPDYGAMSAAHLDEQALIAAYDRARRTATGKELARLNVERAVHATHLAALKGYSPSTGHTTPRTPTIAFSMIPATLRASADTLRKSALTASKGANAALLASIAAAHEVASHG